METGGLKESKLALILPKWEVSAIFILKGLGEHEALKRNCHR
jgi:hypothetical protein